MADRCAACRCPRARPATRTIRPCRHGRRSVPTRTGEPAARELVAALAAREVSARELAERYLGRIESVNGPLNAAVHLDPETTLVPGRRGRWGARRRRAAAAAQPAGLDQGLDLGQRLAVSLGLVCPGASRCVPVQDERARVHVVGRDGQRDLRTNEQPLRSHAGGRRLERRRGRAARRRRVTGRARLDGLCSIRVPAHFCGTASLRPSVGRVPETGAWPTTRDSGMLDMATIGPMGRTVDDVALLLPVIVGAEGIDPLAFHGAVRRRALTSRRRAAGTSARWRGCSRASRRSSYRRRASSS
jgi:amidase